MKPYKHIKLDTYPDIADGKLDGRKASAVNVSVRGGKARSNQSPKKKAAARRYLKHVDKALSKKELTDPE